MDMMEIDEEVQLKCCSNIQTLPDELLIHIFQLLDENTLIVASKCCMRWHQLIQRTSILMENFEISLIKTSEKVFKLIKVFPNGKYRNLFIGSSISLPSGIGNIPDDILNKILVNSIKKLTLHMVKPMTVDKLLIDFNMIRIQHLVLTHYKSDFIPQKVLSLESDKPCNYIELPYLKTLEAHKSHLFLKIIKAPNLTSLKYFDTCSHEKSDFNEILNNFLKRCKSLNNFEVAGPICLFLNHSEISPKLKSLTVDNLNLNDENFAGFLRSQRETLRKLKLFQEEKLDKCHSVIFKELNLDCLEIYKNFTENLFFSNHSIKKIITYQVDETLGRRIFGRSVKFLSGCQRQQELVLYSEHPETLYYIFENLYADNQNLKVLYLTTIPQLPNPNIKFKLLERLEIDKIENVKHLQALPYILNYFPNLKILQITDCINYNDKTANQNFVPQLIVKILTNSKHLEEVTLGMVFNWRFKISTITERFKEIADSGGKLKLLKVRNYEIKRIESEKLCKLNESTILIKCELNIFNGDLEKSFIEIDRKCKGWS